MTITQAVVPVTGIIYFMLGSLIRYWYVAGTLKHNFKDKKTFYFVLLFPQAS